MTLDSDFGFGATIDVNNTFNSTLGRNEVNFIFQFTELSLYVNEVINSTRGDTGYFQIVALNVALKGALGLAAPIINAKLAEGFDINYIVQAIFGTILYVAEMEIVPTNKAIVARLTPAFNFTWTGNTTALASPRTVDLRPLEKYLGNVELPLDTSEEGMQRYIDEKVKRALDL